MLAKKIKKNGLKWFWVRLKSEIHHPTKKISKFVMNFFAFQTKLFIYRDNKNYENLIAIYDLEVSPITYDFVTYLAFAEIEAVSLGFKGFEIVVIPKEKKFVTETIYSEIVNTDEMNWRIKNIILDSTLLSKKCLGIYFPQKRQQAFDYIEGKTLCPSLYTPFHLRVYDAREFYNRSKNEIFQGLCPSPYAQSLLDVWLKSNQISRPYVVITLRDYGYDVDRNSNIPEWVKFSHYLIKSNYIPIIVPDAAKAFNDMSQFGLNSYVFNLACFNIDLRMALYDKAYLNLFVNSGPACFASLNHKCRYLIFKLIVESSSVATEIHLKSKVGLNKGKNFPYAEQWQRLIWEDDIFENIRKNFEEFANDYPA